MLSEIIKESAFLVTNASGRHINLLNDSDMSQVSRTVPSPPSSEISDEVMHPVSPLHKDNKQLLMPIHIASSPQSQSQPPPQQQPPPQSVTKRKYHCIESGCTKSFTTSGHLARHNRIHTGEKNFPCLFPGCQSRFSRQDNMMQHYRTHMSPKSKRTQKKIMSLDLHPRPRLHAHQRIRSDRYQAERPLTIDQHLNNYHQSHPMESNNPTPSSKSDISASPTSSSQEYTDDIPTFYQHKTLFYSADNHPLPYTLLHPICHLYDHSKEELSQQHTHSDSYYSQDTTCDSNPNERSTSSRASLLQLADIVSTFG